MQAVGQLASILKNEGLDPATASDQEITQALDAHRTKEESNGRALQSEQRAGTGGHSQQFDGTPLADAPTAQGGTRGPVGSIVNAAEAYAQAAGIDLQRQAEYVEVNPSSPSAFMLPSETLRSDRPDSVIEKYGAG